MKQTHELLGFNWTKVKNRSNKPTIDLWLVHLLNSRLGQTMTLLSGTADFIPGTQYKESCGKFLIFLDFRWSPL